jgi:hypothetical protein
MAEMRMLQSAHTIRIAIVAWIIRASDLFRVSDFVIRISLASPVAFALSLATAHAAELDDRLAQSSAEYSRRLEELAAWCDQQQLASQAKLTRAWQRAPSPFELIYDHPPTAAGTLLGGFDLPPEAKAWHKRFAELRKNRADEQFLLAQVAIANKRTSLAMHLVNQVLRENPDHPAARRILGFQLHQQQWLTPFAAARQRAGQVWHRNYGWIPERLVARYEAGERFHKGRLISAEQDERLHSSIDTGWEIETERFRITTNHSLAAGARVGELLEQVADVWDQLLAGYLWSHVELAKMFDGAARPATARRKHEVIVFRDENQYRQALRGEIPAEVRTTGIYISRRRTAYFFIEPADAAQKPDDSTLVHEAVHQLFSESRKVAPNVGREANFWVVEGIACYFESLGADEHQSVLGGASTLRMQNARHRLLEEGYYVPLTELTAMGMNDLQRHGDIAKLYSQSAGLTHFLVHGQEGLYRDALVTYLSAVYSGHDRATTLAELTGADFEQLDEQYRQFIKSAQAEASSKE